MNFPFFTQPDAMDCGPACLKMLAAYYGKEYFMETLRNYTFAGKDGVSLLGISKAAEKIGFRTIGGRFTFERLAEKETLPCIVHWDQEHFVIVYKIKKQRRGKYAVFVADPGKGLLKYMREEFGEKNLAKIIILNKQDIK
jgi:ATP-binding cassette subfamily B protein